MMKFLLKLKLKTALLLLCTSLTFISCSDEEFILEEEMQQDDNDDNVDDDNNDDTNDETDDNGEENNFPRLADNEERFYVDNIPANETILTLTGNEDLIDSNTLNQEIENKFNSGGGVIRVTGGTYYLLNIKLRSNVQLKFDADVVIYPDLSGNTSNKNLVIFDIGDTFFVENSAITNTDQNNVDSSTWFKIIIPTGDYKGIRVADYSYVHNFQFSGIKIEDSYSKISNIVLNLSSSNDKNETSQNGIIKDIIAINGHVGYGIVQIQAGKTILFKNLDGTGGTTLRLETGASVINIDNQSTIDDIVGRNIKIRNGGTGITFSPHRVDQGRVDIDGVIAINSAYAVKIAAGFLDNTGSVNNKGTFNELSYVGNIICTGGDKAQLKFKDFKFFDCSTQEILKSAEFNPDQESKSGISIGAIRDNATVASGCDGNGCYEINIENITITNSDFAFGGEYVHDSMSIDCK